MLKLIQYFFELCCFFRSPAELPPSPFMFFTLLLAYMGLYLAIDLLYIGQNWIWSMVWMVVGLNIYMLVTMAIMTFKRVVLRIFPTLCALLGARMLMLIIQAPPEALMKAVEEAGLDKAGWQYRLADSYLTFLWVWWWFIAGRIFAHAAEVGWLLGSAIALAIQALTLAAVMGIFKLAGF